MTPHPLKPKMNGRLFKIIIENHQEPEPMPEKTP